MSLAASTDWTTRTVTIQRSGISSLNTQVLFGVSATGSRMVIARPISPWQEEWIRQCAFAHALLGANSILVDPTSCPTLGPGHPTWTTGQSASAGYSADSNRGVLSWDTYVVSVYQSAGNIGVNTGWVSDIYSTGPISAFYQLTHPDEWIALFGPPPEVPSTASGETDETRSSVAARIRPVVTSVATQSGLTVNMRDNVRDPNPGYPHIWANPDDLLAAPILSVSPVSPDGSCSPAWADFGVLPPGDNTSGDDHRFTVSVDKSEIPPAAGVDPGYEEPTDAGEGRSRGEVVTLMFDVELTLTVTMKWHWTMDGVPPPLHQANRVGGMDAHAAYAVGRATRQSSLLQAGML